MTLGRWPATWIPPASHHDVTGRTRIAREEEVAFPDSHVELAQEGDMRGRWDEHRVAQALSNLMSNAIKYGAADTPVSVIGDRANAADLSPVDQARGLPRVHFTRSPVATRTSVTSVGSGRITRRSRPASRRRRRSRYLTR